MPLNFSFCPTFKSTLATILKSYPKSEKEVIESILSLKDKPLGDRYPGFKDFTIKKIRIALKAYKIGKRGGLRFIYLLLIDKNKVIPLYIYKKGIFKRESYVKEQIKEKLENILKELESGKCTESLLA